eukprot:15192595-Alexandrium_andersonii.AAC.1
MDMLPHQRWQWHVGDGPSHQGSRLASDPGAPGVARGTPARRRRGPRIGQRPPARAPSPGLIQDRR